jgi:hypothetical protein
MCSFVLYCKVTPRTSSKGAGAGDGAVIIGIGRCESGHLTGKEPVRQTNYWPRLATTIPFGAGSCVFAQRHRRTMQLIGNAVNAS